MSTLRQLQDELTGRNTLLKRLVEERDRLESTVNKERSRLWIEANHVTKSQVELSTGDGKPNFSGLCSFAEWINNLSKPKRFAEWIGRVYFTSDLDVVVNSTTFGILDDVPD